LAEEFKIVFFKRTLNEMVKRDIAGERPNTLDALLATVRNRAIDGRYKKNEKPHDNHDERKHGNGNGNGGTNGKVKKFEGLCHWCGKKGHKESECHGKARGDPKKVRKIGGGTGGGDAAQRRTPVLDGLGKVFLDNGSDVSLLRQSLLGKLKEHIVNQPFEINWGGILIKGHDKVDLPYKMNGIKLPV
jgi:hypothetical protein